MTILGATTTTTPQSTPMPYLPKSTSVLAPVEAAFLNNQPGNYGVAVGFGAASKATGPVFMRHVSNPGIVFADFSGKEASSFVNQYDFPASCITSANQLSSLQYGIQGQGSNVMRQYASPTPLVPASASVPYIGASESYLLAPGVSNPYGGGCPYRSHATLACAQGLPDSAALLPSCVSPYTALEQSSYPATADCVQHSYGSYSSCSNCSPSVQMMADSWQCGNTANIAWQPKA